jgi:hypothetical protein
LAFYDHSVDQSFGLLTEYKRNKGDDLAEKKITVEIIINNGAKSPHRVENIATARNALLERIRQKYSKYEYFIMMDSNEYSCIGDIRPNVIQEVLDRKHEWDSISFDRDAGYYDTWALSYSPYVYSFFHFDQWQKVVGMMRDDFNRMLTESKRRAPDEYIEVYSAFNGFAIYKADKFINCRYSSAIVLALFPANAVQIEQEITHCSIINNLTNDCEHRHFHLEAIQKNGAKIRISTKSAFSKFENPPPGLRGPC